jgi:hypothetical protein
VRHTNKKFTYRAPWFMHPVKKQIEIENHEIFQIFHAQSVTFCLWFSILHLDIHMWWWEHISAPLYPLQVISTFSAKHSPDDIKHVSVKISHWFFTILLNWYRVSLLSCLLQAMNSNLLEWKGTPHFPWYVFHIGQTGIHFPVMSWCD